MKGVAVRAPAMAVSALLLPQPLGPTRSTTGSAPPQPAQPGGTAHPAQNTSPKRAMPITTRPIGAPKRSSIARPGKNTPA